VAVVFKILISLSEVLARLSPSLEARLQLRFHFGNWVGAVKRGIKGMKEESNLESWDDGAGLLLMLLRGLLEAPGTGKVRSLLLVLVIDPDSGKWEWEPTLELLNLTGLLSYGLSSSKIK